VTFRWGRWPGEVRERSYVSLDAGGLSNGELVALVVELRARIVAQDAEIADLRARLGQNSRNSSKPPSSDGYAKPPATRSLRRPSGRKPGGQPGHGGRHLQRVKRPDTVLRHRPGCCDGCGGDLADGQLVGEDVRQVFDLPPGRLVVCEHRAERRLCDCGQQTSAAFPGGVSAPAQYGPRIRALVIYLISYQPLPYDRAARLPGCWLTGSGRRSRPGRCTRSSRMPARDWTSSPH
jgi:transposase